MPEEKKWYDIFKKRIFYVVLSTVILLIGDLVTGKIGIIALIKLIIAAIGGGDSTL